MLFFLSFLMSSFCPQYGAFIDDAYIQEVEEDDDEIDSEDYTDDDNIVALTYNDYQSSGQFINISHVADSNTKDEPVDKKTKKDCKASNKKEQSDDAASDEKQEPEIQEADYEKVIERDITDSRMIQLASAIAGDMGMILKVSIER